MEGPCEAGTLRAAAGRGLVLLFAVACLVHVAVSGAPVSEAEGGRLAAAFLSSEITKGSIYPQAVELPAQVTIQKTTELRDSASGDLLGYVFELVPRGFVVVTAETRLAPVVAYSDLTQFSWQETPRNTLLLLLRTDLRMRMEALRAGKYAWEEVNANEAKWVRYLTDGEPGPRATTWGPWITTSTWNQDAPYWDSCPIDPITGERCYVGCGATALSQILNYWRLPVSVAFTHADDYTSTYDPGDGKGERVVDIDATQASIPIIDYGGGEPGDAMRAAISYAAGVSLRMGYSSEGSGSSCANVAAALAGDVPAWSWVVPERWQYTSADYRTTDVDWQPWPPYYATAEEIYSLLQDDAAHARPSVIVVASDTSGHFVVVDGYKTTGEYHVNFGWGGYNDSWYFLPTGLPNEYNAVTDAVVNIVPPSLPEETAAVFRVNSAGEAFADADVFGAGFVTGSADVAEWVPVRETLEAGTVLELDTTRPGWYRMSRGPCSALVAGVVSLQPGLVLGQTEPTEGMALLALSGIVPVKVTNEGGPIQPGDLLVSSSTPGYAMRWSGSGSCSRGFVGKALESMTNAQGVVLVLLAAH